MVPYTLFFSRSVCRRMAAVVFDVVANQLGGFSAVFALLIALVVYLVNSS